MESPSAMRGRSTHTIALQRFRAESIAYRNKKHRSRVGAGLTKQYRCVCIIYSRKFNLNTAKIKRRLNAARMSQSKIKGT